MEPLAKYTVILFLILCSCNTEDRPAVYSGIYDSGFIYNEFNPLVVVNLEHDTVYKTYGGLDSIDLNIDGLYDIIIMQRLTKPLTPGSFSFEQFPYYRLTTKNGVEIATRIENYAVGHGQTQTISWVDTISYQARIDDFKDWSGPGKNITMWMIPSSPVNFSNGCWFSVKNPEKFIGIRMKAGSHYKYGWIKVDATNKESIHFLSFAIEK